MIISVKSHKFWRSDLIMMWLNVTLCVAYDWRWNCKSVVCAERREQATRLCVITCYLITRTLREVTFAHLVKPAQELNRLDDVCTAGIYVPGKFASFQIKNSSKRKRFLLCWRFGLCERLHQKKKLVPTRSSGSWHDENLTCQESDRMRDWVYSCLHHDSWIVHLPCGCVWIS